jgi:hypothetical protein
MRRIFCLLLIAGGLASAAGCTGGPSETSADSSNRAEGLLDKIKPKPKIAIPAGSRLRVALVDAVSTKKNSPGDRFLATLAEPVIVGGKIVLQKGTKVRGSIIDVKESGRVKGRASIRLILTEIIRDNGKNLPLSTKPFTAVAESTKKRDAGIIGGGAGLGAAIGAIAGGGKGAAIGAAAGGGAGTGAVLATRGKDIHYGPETRLTFTLATPVEI